MQTEVKPGLFADGGGLYLQVTATGAKSWVLRFQIAGRRRDMGLGSVALFSLAEARGKALELRKLVAEGIVLLSGSVRTRPPRRSTQQRQ